MVIISSTELFLYSLLKLNWYNITDNTLLLFKLGLVIILTLTFIINELFIRTIIKKTNPKLLQKLMFLSKFALLVALATTVVAVMVFD